MLCLTYLEYNSAKNRFLITNDLKSIGIGNYLVDFSRQPRHGSSEIYFLFSQVIFITLDVYKDDSVLAF